ncbi:MAG: hypothetical protein HYY55_03665 [Candidatus Niyogibacteria bacterium]|nr:MAG: hypothetical protein HYY55_03665 [Candidatus Niyogibacteria bacterium]
MAKTEEKKHIITPEMWPEARMETVQGQDGRPYLVQNNIMFTGVRHSRGEFSPFFIDIRDKCRIFGHRCPECRHIIVPPYQQRCVGECNFVPLVKEYVKDIGVLVATPVITVFPPALFKDAVPFGEGDVYLETVDGELTDTALPVCVRTTTGAIRPGIYKRGTPVKIVFCNQREGSARDIFVIPQSELTPEQIAKSPLFEHELRWASVAEIKEEENPAMRQVFEECFELFCRLRDMVSQSRRAKKDLANWHRIVHIKTKVGTFELSFYNGTFAPARKPGGKEPQLIIVIPDPRQLSLWLKDSMKRQNEQLESPALTDLVLEGVIILDRPEIETVIRLDRIPRSLRRDGVV